MNLKNTKSRGREILETRRGKIKGGVRIIEREIPKKPGYMSIYVLYCIFIPMAHLIAFLIEKLKQFSV